MSKARVIAAVLVVLAMVSLSGCDVLHHEYVDEQRDGGVTPQTAEDLLLSIDGITAAKFETQATYSPGEGGMFSSEGMNVVLDVTVDPDWSIADPEAFLGFLAATAWSVNDHIPDGAVSLSISGGVDKVFDWTPIAAKLFNDEDLYVYDHGAPVIESSSDYGKRFGRWPSEPVDVPAGMLINVPPTITVVPAYAAATLTESYKDDCYDIDFERGFGGLGLYPGTVTATLLGDGVELGTMQAAVDEDQLEFCLPTGEHPTALSAMVSTETIEGFTDVSETLVVS